MSEMCVFAMMYNLNVPVVALFHFVRILTVYLTVPYLTKWHIKRKAQENTVLITTEQTDSAIGFNVDDSIRTSETFRPRSGVREFSFALTLSVGLVSGYIFWRLNIPNGAMLGAMLAIGGIRIVTPRVKGIPRKYITIAQIVLGCSLGLELTPEVARFLFDLAGVSILFSVLTLLCGFGLALIITKLFKVDMVTSVLACSTAGVSQMSAIALEMDADVLSVSVMHCLRLIIIVVALPPMIMLMAH
jgi:membrane AbrB-like protein